MSKIITIKKRKSVNQSEDIIKCFIPSNMRPNLQDYREIIFALENAEKTVFIASINGINNKILEAIYTAISNSVRVYIILKSFTGNESTLIKFNKNKPAIIREIPELENNFIAVDGKTTLFLNSLSEDKNITIALDKKKSQDLNYWFNYYFWNKAEKEKIVDKIDTPKDSPYPPFFSEKEEINLQVEELGNITRTIIPCDKKYQEAVSKCEKLFLSRDITTPIHFSGYKTKVGQLEISKDLFNSIGDIFELSEINLGSINTEIIPFYEDDWNRTIMIEHQITDKLGGFSANSIEEMENTFPEKYPEHKHCLNINYEWEVIPPLLPRNVKKAELYKQFKTAQTKLEDDLIILERELNSIIEKESSVIGFFTGAKRKAQEKLKEILEWRKIELVSLSFNELKDRFCKNGDFQNFYTSIISETEDFKTDIDKKEEEEAWKDRKKEKEDLLGKKKKEQLIISQKIKEEPSKKLNSINSEIKSLESEIEKKYTRFVYNNSGNELTNLKKDSNTKILYKQFNIPKYVLPEVGILFEDKSTYFLQIENYEELETANEIAQNRYIDKPCKVVAKGDNK